MPSGRHKEFDEEEVLGKALEQFWETGYEATGLSELLERMGIGRQSLYATFGDKHNLFLQALRKYGEEQTGRIVSILTAPGSGLNNIHTLWKRSLDTGPNSLRKGCLLANTIAELAARDDEVGQVAGHYLSRIEHAFLTAVTRGQEHEEIRSDMDAVMLSRMLITTFQGAALLSKVPKNKAMLRDVMHASVTTLMNPKRQKNAFNFRREQKEL